MGIPYQFTAKCGHAAESDITDATTSKIRARRAYWRKTACRACRESDLKEEVAVVARCGHDATAYLDIAPNLKSSPAQRRASARQYWKTHDCHICWSQTPCKPAHRATFKCGHEDWHPSSALRRPDIAAKVGQIVQKTEITDMKCYACEDKDNPCLPDPTHRIVTYICGHKETVAEPVHTYYRVEACGVCTGRTEPPPPPPNAIISTRRPKGVVREDNGQKFLEARRRSEAGLIPWPLPDDWRDNPTPGPSLNVTSISRARPLTR